MRGGEEEQEVTEPDDNQDLEGTITKYRYFVIIGVLALVTFLVFLVAGCKPNFDPYPDYRRATATPTPTEEK